jgi:hypothetical protein
VEKQAEVVRLIYKLFLEGKTTTGIAKHLTLQGIPTPSGKQKWRASTVESILKNEKYAGNALLQKAFTVDFLTKKKKINEGEVPQYFVENSHPAVIEPQVYDLVQHEFKKRKSAIGYKTGGSCFSGEIVCGECGSFYGSKVWHSNDKYRRVIWQCNHKFSNDERCKTPHLYEDELKQAFVDAFNNLMGNKKAILAGYDEMATRYEASKKRLYELNEQRLDRRAKREKLVEFIATLSKHGGLLAGFDEGLWNALVETVTVHGGDKMTFKFKDGTELGLVK